MMSSNELFNKLKEDLKEFYQDIKIEENYYIAVKGTIPIVLVAHLDTVFNDATRKDINVYCDAKQGVWWSPNGLGADDRAGVMMILKILERTKLRPHILFTLGEETTGNGAFKARSLKKDYFGPISYVIELDRMGREEAVYYLCNNKSFEEFINNFGFHTCYGTFTDISILCPEWEVAGVNLSVGYINEHSYLEHFFEDAWKDTYNKVINMLNTKCDRIWKYIPKGDNK